MEPTTTQIQEIKDILEKEHGRKFSWDEASKAAWDLNNLAQLAFNLAVEKCRMEDKLKEYPEGYHFEGKGTCLVCGGQTSDENSWYDKNGLKCMTCQKAINKKNIPLFLVGNKECWYSKFDLEDYFNLKGPLLKKLVKDGILKERVVLNENNKVHLQLFLLEDNEDFLPPKNLLQSKTIKVEKNGEEYFTSARWYEYFETEQVEKLKKYAIVNYFAETFSMPIETGRFYYKQISPIFQHKNL